MMNNIKIPTEINIFEVIDGSNKVIKTTGNVWNWKSRGVKYKIEWSKYNFNLELLIYLKLFIIDRFKKLSLESISRGDIIFIKSISRFNLEYPFNSLNLIEFFNQTKDYRNIYTFRKFFEFGANNLLPFYSKEVHLEIKNYNIGKRTPYERVFLQQNFITESEIFKIKNCIRQIELKTCSFHELQNNIIIHLAYELAPRRSQFYLLNISDFNIVNNSTNNYFSINLPMSKKRSLLKIEKRHRSISNELGEKIKLLLEKRNNKKNNALFINQKNKRLDPINYSNIVKKEFNAININRTITDLRHHLAQSLADQGASAEVIAEIMGHNSTVPARAYITATPKIADIKSEALAKNIKYNEITKMMIGDFSIESQTKEKNKVKGAIGRQYIGGIGSCGLPSDTSCNKNPVYACYTCVKFHPFKNEKQHNTVKIELQKQAQFFIDIAEFGNDIEHNRPVTQLSSTIRAVQNVLDLIQKKHE